jgi:hypothetical protein
MQPLRNTKSIRFGRLKMYREDLDALVGLFQKSCASVTISDDKNSYDSLAEMKQYVGSQIKDFNVKGENPKVHFLLNKAESVPSSTPGQPMTQLFPELRTEEATDAADTLFYMVREHIQTHQRTALTPAVLIFGIIAIAVTITLGIEGFRAAHLNPQSAPSDLPLLWFFVSGVMLVIIMIWSNRGHFLSLDTRLESPSFFQRYKEDFKKQAVTALISSLIGGVIGYVFGHFLKR